MSELKTIMYFITNEMAREVATLKYALTSYSAVVQYLN